MLTFNEDEIGYGGAGNKYNDLEFDLSKYAIAQFSDTEDQTIFKQFF